ncbi:MAG: 3-deoxy-manno-octulosonate cytidylyltransferase [Bacteroidetes bacterium]|nr:3-deoxy-manno-octulosonate cytidylyltransferase [Bacteroidota bacterium]
MNFIGIIPARYMSSRFPGKALFVIEGKTMIQRVYEQAKQSSALAELYVATDDVSIENHVKKFGGKVVMTAIDHSCGTERCLEAFNIINVDGKYSDDDVIINIQGDEPCINPEQIDIIASCFKNEEVKIATLVAKIKTTDDLLSPTVMKVVCDKNKKALYFSRSPIPFFRGLEQTQWIQKNNYYQHIGIYAYRASILGEICKLPQSSLEKAESLEQLRWLENGYSINIEFTEHASHSVDVPADVEKIINLLKGSKI